MTRLGVSTSVLERREDFDTLLAHDPDVVEVYNYPSDLLARLDRFTRRRGIQLALHTPVPYDLAESLRRFAPTGPDPVEAAAALRLTEATVRCAADLGALHVVVHFPSPYPPYPAQGFRRWSEEYLGATAALARDHGVPVLIENLSAHPLLHTPDHYRRALEDHPALGMCLDLGHAHLLADDAALGFADALGPRIRSMHVYNTSADRYPRHGHEPAAPGQRAADGYLDLPALLPALLRRTDPAVLVMEHRAPDTGPALRTAAWLRALIEAHHTGVTA